MPEGDNIHAHAATLSRLLAGAPLRAVFSRGVELRGLRGRKVSGVTAVGKHLVMQFDDGAAVRVHLGVAGGWRRVARADRDAMAQADLALATDEVTLLGRARQVEWTRARLAAGTRALARLGPDLAAGAIDLDAIVARARRPDLAARPVGELLLDQSVAAGLGNIYKCELLFLHRLDPWTRVDALTDAALRALYADAARRLRANVGRSRGRPWVYGRAGRPCHRCGAPIVQRRQGPARRPTWFCPRCQPSVASRVSGASPN